MSSEEPTPGYAVFCTDPLNPRSPEATFAREFAMARALARISQTLLSCFLVGCNRIIYCSQ